MKKRLSLMLMIITVLCSFNIAAAEDKPSHTADEKVRLAYELLVSLNIVEPEFIPDNSAAVTKNAFAKSLAAMLGIEAGVVTAERYFSDVERGSVINDLTALKIIYQEDKFNPNENIAAKEAVIMTLRALGYDAYINALGGETLRYMQVAAEIGLAARVSEGTLSTQDMTVLLNNALNCKRYAPDKLSSGLSFKEEEPLISEKYDVYKYEGLVTANRYASLIEGEKTTRKNELKISGEVFSCRIEDCESFIGRNVILYYCDDGDGKREILCMVTDTEKSAPAEFDSKAVENVTESRITYDGGKKIKINNPLVIYNGKVMFDISKSRKNEIFNDDNTFFRFYRQSDSEDYTIAVAEKYEDCLVSGVDLYGNMLYYTSVSAGLSYALSYEDDIYMNISADDGTKIGNPEELLRDDFISVAADAETGFAKIIKCTKTVTGKIEKISDGGNYAEAAVGGTVYGIDKRFAKSVTIGENGNYRLNAFGNIAYKGDSLNDADFTFGYVYKRGLKSGMEDSAEYKIFTANNEHKVYKLARKVKIDSDRTVSYTEADSRLAPGGVLKCRLIRFKLNSAGEINCIDTAEKGRDESEESLSEIAPKAIRRTYVFAPGKSYRIAGNSDDIAAGNYFFPFSGSTVIFGIPAINDGEEPEEIDFKLYGSIYDSSVNDVNNMVTLYKVGDKTPFINAAVFDEYTNTSNNIYAQQTWLVNKTAKAVDENGNPTTMVQVLITTGGGTTRNLYLNDTVKIQRKDGITDVNGEDAGDYITSGDIIQYKSAENGLVKDIALTYDYSEGTDGIFWSDTYSYESQTFQEQRNKVHGVYRFLFGNLYKLFNEYDNTYLYLSDIDKNEFREACQIVNRVPIYDPTRNGAKAYLGTVYYPDDYDTGNVSRVFIHYSDGANIGGIVFYK